MQSAMFQFGKLDLNTFEARILTAQFWLQNAILREFYVNKMISMALENDCVGPQFVLNDRVWLVVEGTEDKNVFAASNGSTDGFEECLCKLLRQNPQITPVEAKAWELIDFGMNFEPSNGAKNDLR